MILVLDKVLKVKKMDVNYYFKYNDLKVKYERLYKKTKNIEEKRILRDILKDIEEIRYSINRVEEIRIECFKTSLS